MRRLPIEVIAERPHLRFRWSARPPQHMASRAVACEGVLQPGLDIAVAELIRAYRELERENAELRAAQAQTV